MTKGSRIIGEIFRTTGTFLNGPDVLLCTVSRDCQDEPAEEESVDDQDQC